MTTSKVWFLTGSSRGLGRALAEAILDSGDSLFATARRKEDLRALSEKYGDRVRTFALDVTSSAQAHAAIAEATRAFGRIDVVVNNAGYANSAAFEALPEDDYRAQIDTNFFGVVNVTRAAVPVLRAQRSGHIIQISSIGGRTATPGLSAYQAAKFAVGGFSEVIAKELAPLGIHVTVAEPGGMKTDWAGSSMKIYDTPPDYAQSVGPVAALMRGATASARGDPAKVSLALIAITKEKNPPLRLLLGTDSVFMAGLAREARVKEDTRWEALSRSTDFAGESDFATTDVAKFLAGQTQ